MPNDEKNGKKFFSVVVRVAFLTAAILIAVYVLTVFVDSDKYINAFSEKNAYLSFETTVSEAEELARRPFDELNEVAVRLAAANSIEEVNAVMSEYVGSPLYGDLRYYAKGNAFDADGLLIEGDFGGREFVDALVSTHAVGCTDLYYDVMLRQDCMAFYIPIHTSEYVDGVVSILSARGLLSLDSLVTGNLSSVILVDQYGKMVAVSQADGAGYDLNKSSIFGFFDEFIHDKDAVQSIGKDLSSGKKILQTTELLDGDYVLCSVPLDTFDGKLTLVALTKSDGIVAPELVYIRHVANISILAVIALIVGAVCAFSFYKRSKRELTVVTYTEPTTGCPNAAMFKKTATDIMSTREASYAVAIFEVRQFRYLSETMGEAKTKDFLTMVAKVFDTFCTSSETYGYSGNGKFAHLISVRNENSVKERLNIIGSVVSKNMASEGKTKQYFNIGVANTVQGKRLSVTELLQFAEIACERARNNMNLPYVTFDDNLGSEKKRNERIEAEMENALATGEFRIFLQPKYGVAADRVDSAEVLVRWFDPKKGDYRYPGEFIGLFETNGFITKLDHFVYIESLKYLSQAVEHGDPVVPVSINVSMVTVNSPDFLNFYIENKKKYRVGDNFVIIEFTESFAMEDYDSIRRMVDTLHENGIRCSLDDFGSGYSSLTTLKNIPFDEIKFDRLFLSKGYHTEGDYAIVEAMYSLAKKLGIRTVQEGVEDKETFDRVVANGCDLIQGYYYAKAIPVEEYRMFIKTNTSIKFKSRVK